MAMDERIYNAICNDRLMMLSERIDHIEKIKYLLKLAQQSKQPYVGQLQLIEQCKKNEMRELSEMMNADPEHPPKGVTDWINLKYKDVEGDFEGRLKILKEEYEDIRLNGISEKAYEVEKDFFMDRDLGDDYD